MSELVRFGVSLKKPLLDAFDRHVRSKKYPTRSKAIEDLIREDLVKKDWSDGGREVAGAITMVYNHHKRELVNHLLDTQHDHQTVIVSTQHVHLSHHHCLEVIVVKGTPAEVKKLLDTLQAEKGVHRASLSLTATEG